MVRDNVVDFESAKKYIKELKAEKIALLGEGECFVRRDGDGFLESIKMNVTLTEGKKEIYKIGEKWCISASGYDKLNQAAGLSVVAPKTINLDGRNTGNPHFEFDMHKQNLRAVTVRRIVVGPSPIGNLVAIERLLRFDVDMYFLEDLQFKVKKRAGAGGYGTHEVKPSTISNKDSAVMFPLGPAALWVDVSHVDIQDAFREHIRRCKYAERMATTMCERNAFASHPAIARRHVEPVGGVVVVPVFGGRMIVNQDRIKELMAAFEEGDFTKVEEVEVVTATEVETPALEEVLTASEEDELSPSGETEDKSETPKTPPVKQTAAWKKAHDQIYGFKEMDPQVYFKVIEEEGIRNLNTMTTRELNNLKKKLEKA